MAHCHSGWRRDSVRVGRHLTHGPTQGHWIYPHVERGANRFDTSHLVAWRWFVFLSEYRSKREPGSGRGGLLGSEISCGSNRNDRLSPCRGCTHISEKAINAVTQRCFGCRNNSLLAIPHYCALLEARGAVRPFGDLRTIRRQLYLLELVRISEHLLSCTRCGHDGRLGLGWCSHR